MKMVNANKKVLILTVLAIVAVLAMAFESSAAEEKPAKAKEKPLNEKWTTAAWDTFKSGKYALAITNADLCIDEFQGQADLLEKALEKDKPDLPTGRPPNGEIKEKIFANGLLNDVASCLFIKGRAFEKLGHKEEAKKAFEQAKQYPYARAWDPDQELFWSPAEAAAGRLERNRPAEPSYAEG
jgi:tetratricopeptide (TPR) repeat protein